MGWLSACIYGGAEARSLSRSLARVRSREGGWPVASSPFYDDFSDGFQPANFNILQQKGCVRVGARWDSVAWDCVVCAAGSSVPDNFDLADPSLTMSTW